MKNSNIIVKKEGKSQLKLELIMKRGVLLVRVGGDLDMHVVNEFRQLVDAAVDEYSVKNIILDFSNMTFIDSSGIGVILGRYKRVIPQGGQIIGINVKPQMTKIFELSGMHKVIKFLSSEAAAFDCILGGYAL